MTELEFVAPAMGGPCDGQMLRGTTPLIKVPVVEGYSEPDEYGIRVPIFGAATYVRNEGYWVVLSIERSEHG